jgi:hypothetical protein
MGKTGKALFMTQGVFQIGRWIDAALLHPEYVAWIKSLNVWKRFMEGDETCGASTTYWKGKNGDEDECLRILVIRRGEERFDRFLLRFLAMTKIVRQADENILLLPSKQR